LSQFRHANDQSQRGALANAGDTQNEIKPHRQIVVAAQTIGNVTNLRHAPRFQSCNVAIDDAAQPRLIDVL